ncbi:MAG TPA: penicillin-binding protein 2 [Solirubrobacteraceae bacterium]|nr:penicillin-binding protein 2 [Solirubrobacteraceae bacterium]
MNRPIIRLYGLVAVLFALLVAFTSRWTVFEASSLRNNKLNARKLLEQQRIDRGPILAANGVTIARSVREAEGIYQRTYPFGPLFANAIGYAFTNPDLGATGVELYRNEDLNGQSSGNLQSVLDQLQGKEPAGDRVLTSLDPAAQRVAESQLAGHEGAVVALEPRTGAVTVMASAPSYNPNGLRSSAYRAQIGHAAGNPLVNRATQFGYAPGSTFKVITATAAIDSGAYTTESTVSGRNDVVVSGLPLQNDNNESLGQITLKEALAKSVNTVWAQVAEHVGKATLARYMERFGFDSTPQLDYPADEMSPSGEYRNGHLITPTSTYVDLGRMGIGQDKLAVTPLQMAEVAATVANGGRLMSPHIARRIVDSEGRTVTTVGPHLQSVVMKPSTAAAVRTMMEAVVNEGTGTTAQIPGVQVAGKTGTAETQIGTAINNVWFIAFAPAANPRVAVAVTLKAVPGQGASFAAPVAKAVIERLLHD